MGTENSDTKPSECEYKKMNHPSFAVVGHPNKGKSSIVSALALDDTVAISNVPGTTHTKRSFPLKVDGITLYELFDTPGFQRARSVLEWLTQHEVSADKKQDVVRAFVQEHKNNPKFHDEIELLEPILGGAGIIYVVDASKPYSSEYEAEMEILRWCNQPSMALINHIDKNDYTQEWKRALGHYFKLIRTYNPMHATFAEHKNILESMAHLNEEWMPSLKNSIALFQKQHQQKIVQVGEIITRLIYDALTNTNKLSIKGESPTPKEAEDIAQKYQKELRNLEANSYKQIAQTLQHTHLKQEIFTLPFEETDLFSKESASIFGLSKKELLLTTTTSGALTGAGVDLLLAGHTGFLGAALGGLVGGVGGYFGFEELFHTRLLGKKIGSKQLQIGPMQNKNFPYILLGRALFYTKKLLRFSHAKREAFVLGKEEQKRENILSDKQRQKLEKYHKLFRADKRVDSKVLQEYRDLVITLIEEA
jgi:GTPase Era involved in 16S rRNA processing